MTYDSILYSVEDRIARITINQPEKMNRLSNKVLQEIIEAAGNADRDDNVRVVIISGAGERAFCAGADLSAISHDSAFRSMESLNLYAELCLVFHRMKKPSIARMGAWPYP